jgi:hypothetical protein
VENEWLYIVEGSAPSETKDEIAHRVRARGVGALVTIGNFAPLEEDDGDTPAPIGTLSENWSGRAALNMEQQEQLVSNQCWELSIREARWDQSQRLQAQPSENNKWFYACRLLRLNSLKEGALYHVDSLLGNDRGISKYAWTITE